MGLLRVRPWPQKRVGSLLEAAVAKHQQRHTGSVDRLGVERNREDKLLSVPTKLATEHQNRLQVRQKLLEEEEKRCEEATDFNKIDINLV